MQLVTDYEFGVGIDTVAKQNQEKENTYFYSFEYKSWNDYLAHWMGKPHFVIFSNYKRKTIQSRGLSNNDTR